MCTLLGNYEALDFLESQASRVAFKIPDPRASLEKELVAVSNLIREVGEALESVAETLADGVVEESELKVTVPKIEAVIQECASLKYLLEDLCKRKRKKAGDNHSRFTLSLVQMAETQFLAYCTRVEKFLLTNYGIAVITRDIPDPLTGDLDGL
jgi:hypothetical protein